MTKLLSSDLSFDIYELLLCKEEGTEGVWNILSELNCWFMVNSWIEGSFWFFERDFYSDEFMLLLIEASEMMTFSWLGLLDDLIVEIFEDSLYTLRGGLISSRAA
jgi:hypothetical protein